MFLTRAKVAGSHIPSPSHHFPPDFLMCICVTTSQVAPCVPWGTVSVSLTHVLPPEFPLAQSLSPLHHVSLICLPSHTVLVLSVTGLPGVPRDSLYPSSLFFTWLLQPCKARDRNLHSLTPPDSATYFLSFWLTVSSGCQWRRGFCLTLSERNPCHLINKSHEVNCFKCHAHSKLYSSVHFCNIFESSIRGQRL
jgi:hypothetical protein